MGVNEPPIGDGQWSIGHLRCPFGGPALFWCLRPAATNSGRQVLHGVLADPDLFNELKAVAAPWQKPTTAGCLAVSIVAQRDPLTQSTN
ncbi:hypothetical protein M514_07484 [Trichuris suis]|uniref:Uncharacterized protein n=1 Tax=Trichuris suis TaxID=68888 RepID=A0A085NE47_9BILA|nr:hypothetical protein M513_07484 [Trichuris suis]KFD67743.1 hypothetical protein M514_07484 [Trichuris suis]